jgi:hypothetical protein
MMGGACSMYDADKKFIKNFERELKESTWKVILKTFKK